MSEFTTKPNISFLSDEAKDEIHQAALRLLNEVPMEVHHEEALELLKGAGCSPQDDRFVTIPESLVQQSIEKAPENISMYDRLGNPAMDLGGHRSYFGTGSDLIYSFNSETNQRHQCVLEDVGTAARVADALPNIDFIMSFAHPSDIAPQRSYLLSFQAMAANSIKPIVCTAECRDDLSEIRQIALILRGNDDALRSQPYFILYVEPISPLKHPFDSVDKLLFCAENAIPAIYSPAPIAGSTAPMTIAGHVAQGMAECLFGLVIHQLKQAGAPFMMGMGPAVLDMSTAECSYNAPEYLLSYMAAVEMSHYYNLPNWGYAGTSDSQIPDGQATFEAGLETFLSTMAGSNLNHDVGYLDFGRTGSLEMLVIQDECIDQMRRIYRGIPISDEMLAVDVVREVGSQGDFLSHPHSLKHLRETQWRPTLSNRLGFEAWENAGKPSLLQRAKQKLKSILQEHAARPIPRDQAGEIQYRVDRFKT
jgi:trimethylamine--corrinoid protein Co-methyltransferase